MKFGFVPAALLAATVFGAVAPGAQARVISQNVEYRSNGQLFEGFIAYDTRFTGRRPGVLVAHQWKGITDYEKERARMLAQMGYIAFCVDVYGKGVRPTNPRDAGAQAGKYRENRRLLKSRAQAGYAILRDFRLTDRSKIAAIGYCFGGATVLELARSGADVKGVVSFHGTLSTPNPQEARRIKGSVLVLHGAVDPLSPFTEVQKLRDEMTLAKVDHEIVLYGNAVHSFTERAAGNDASDGVAYDEKADRRSWNRLREFLREIF